MCRALGSYRDAEPAQSGGSGDKDAYGVRLKQTVGELQLERRSDLAPSPVWRPPTPADVAV